MSEVFEKLSLQLNDDDLKAKLAETRKARATPEGIHNTTVMANTVNKLLSTLSGAKFVAMTDEETAERLEDMENTIVAQLQKRGVYDDERPILH